MEKHDLQILCFSLFIVIGISLASVFYHSSSQTIESILYNLDNVIGSSDPAMIYANLSEIQTSLDIIMEKIPETINNSRNGETVAKNPVLIYPEESTNFLRIQNDVDAMITNIEKISLASKDTSAYHVGMMDISDRAIHLKENIRDAAPYMHNTPEHIISNSVWLIGIMGISEILLRRSSSLSG